MRLAAYAGTSALVAAGALLKAFHQRPNFYSATVYLSQSNACVLILTNLALVCACSFMYGLQRLYYGPLRPVEVEQLSEKAWYAVLDTLLAMPSLRDDVGGWMLAIFVLLLGGKVWGWIGEGRVDILEQQPPQNPRLFHARLSSSLVLSVAFDVYMLQYCLGTVLNDPRPGMMVIFTFEFAILTVFSLFTLSRYVLALLEARILQNQTTAKIEERREEIRAERERVQQEQMTTDGVPAAAQQDLPQEDDIDENEIDVPGWEEKRRWLFGLELATDFVKLIIYSVFFAISLTFMGLPMHIMRDVYLTFSAFAKRIKDYGNYRRATRNMNNRYPDATAEELSNENTCIVCREIMAPWEQPYGAAGNAPRSGRMNEGLRAKKLPCGHILHLRCLKAWLERQQACPTCRRPVIAGADAQNAAVQGQPAQPGAQGANLAGQQPAPGANVQPDRAQAGAAVAPPERRPNRLRMLNLGPIRIGVYNGPAHQVQDALAQRNQQAQGAAGTGRPSGSPSALGSTSTQIQLMQVEERLMHEARNLAIEQAQLSTVRLLEAELARLRAEHSRNQLTTTLEDALRRGPSLGTIGHVPFGGYALPQALQPILHQAPLANNHADLPQGMTLPEGWTLTPLHRVGGMPQQEVSWSGAQSTGASSESIAGPNTDAPAAPDVSAELAAFPPADITQSTVRPPASPSQRANIDQGAEISTDVPTTAEIESGDVLPEQPEASSSSSAVANTMPSGNAQQPTTSQQTTEQAPWTNTPSWGFDWADKEPSNGTESEAIPEANGNLQSNGEAGPSGKGKGRAVTVEDVQDVDR
ncbi:hypothetical protein MBLNU459_g8250t1 [Dothideomycetes sp. NU459]